MSATTMFSLDCNPGCGSDGLDASPKSCSGCRSVPGKHPGFVGSSSFVIDYAVMNTGRSYCPGSLNAGEQPAEEKLFRI
jgi:hypothetical protein